MVVRFFVLLCHFCLVTRRRSVFLHVVFLLRVAAILVLNCDRHFWHHTLSVSYASCFLRSSPIERNVLTIVGVVIVRRDIGYMVYVIFLVHLAIVFLTTTCIRHFWHYISSVSFTLDSFMRRCRLSEVPHHFLRFVCAFHSFFIVTCYHFGHGTVIFLLALHVFSIVRIVPFLRVVSNRSKCVHHRAKVHFVDRRPFKGISIIAV